MTTETARPTPARLPMLDADAVGPFVEAIYAVHDEFWRGRVPLTITEWLEAAAPRLFVHANSGVTAFVAHFGLCDCTVR